MRLTARAVLTGCTAAPSGQWRILHIPIAERPVRAPHSNQADPYVLEAQPCLQMNAFCNRLVQGPFDFDGAAEIPGYLDKHDAWCVVDAQIACLRVHQFIGGMARNDLELVVHGYIGDIDQGVVDDVADSADLFRGGILADIEPD